MTDATAGLLGRLNGRVTLWLARCAAVILALMALVTFCDVIGRYVFNRPFSFTLEFVELAMGLIVYLAVGLVTHEREHVSVDFVTLKLPPRLRLLVGLAVDLVALTYLAVLVWRLFGTALSLYGTGDFTPVWFVPLWPFAFLIAAASTLFLTGTLLHLCTGVSGLIAGRGAG